MILLEVVSQGFLGVLGEAGAEGADEQFAERPQAEVVLGLAVHRKRLDLSRQF